MRVRRAALYMPGDSIRKIKKAANLSVDCIIMDLEDGVAFNQKAAARTTTLQALQTIEFAHHERLIRINRVGSGLTATDLIETIAGHPDGYVLPKVESAREIIYLDCLLSDLEALHNLPPRQITVQAIIETTRGVMALAEIAQASSRLTALQFGAEDLAAELGATRSKAGAEVFYARSAVVMAAKAYGLQAIDGVYLNFADTKGAYEEAKRAAEMGYDGKLAIHPKQIEPYHRAFTPTDKQIAAAHRLVEAANAHQASGIGAFVLDGKMIDPAIVKPAEQLLAKASAASRIKN